MLQPTDFVALTDMESAAIVGGNGFLIMLVGHLLSNLDSFMNGVRDGYAAASAS